MGQLPPVKEQLSRRKFFAAILGAGASLATAFYFLKSKKKSDAAILIPGKIVGASASRGHMLRELKNYEPGKITKKDVVIVGAGISGLSAGRHLLKNGVTDFEILELENSEGGNAKSGKNEISSYPWGAHYLPIPDPSLKELIGFLEENKIITGYENDLPVYDDLHLCFDPHERLFINGYWQEGIVPSFGVGNKTQQEFSTFFDYIEEMKIATGSDGKPAFTIPLDNSSADNKYRDLDKISFRNHLREKGYSTEEFFWYMDYCCRDDYGTTCMETSAWAGIHYFAGRKGKAANVPGSAIMTWSEGNMYLVNALAKDLRSNISTGKICIGIKEVEEGIFVDIYDFKTHQVERIICKTCISSIPQFIHDRLVKSSTAKAFTYSPWMVANITVQHDPGGKGAPLSWDNVIYNSKSLGYVNATNQAITRTREQVFTYYLPLTNEDPVSERRKALERTHEDWKQLILKDLERVHRGISDNILNIDVMVWGHAMIRPSVGFIWGDERKKILDHNNGRIIRAHSDLSGISIFEEAFYRGIKAATTHLENTKS